MSDFVKDIETKIKEKRERVRESTLKSYIFNINKLAKTITGDPIKSLKFLDDKEKVMKSLEELKPTTRKTKLASIVVILSAFDKDEKLIKFYRDEMLELQKGFQEDMDKNEKSEAQEKNWTSLANLRKVMRKYKNELIEKGVFNKPKSEITDKEFKLMQKWIVSSLYVLDDANPPRRLEYAETKIIKEADYKKLSEKELKNNYLVVRGRNNKFFSFGDHKSEGKYGLQKITIGKKLNSALNIWLKYNDSNFLLSNSQHAPMSRNSLTKFIQKVFEPTGKQIGASMIRHIYISEKFPAEKQDEKEQVATKMGHSEDMQNQYSKKN